uniref:Uncharacterized protein n=1 Tax=Nelumbo nucifera TaxID=4432 RepID=A0A822YA05_NELNU|nr:TPA_asm: hypothetical protein HUJ06_030705 [Nelumbo nucifera]
MALMERSLHRKANTTERQRIGSFGSLSRGPLLIGIVLSLVTFLMLTFIGMSRLILRTTSEVQIEDVQGLQSMMVIAKEGFVDLKD